MRGGGGVVAQVLSNHRLRRVELAFMAFSLAEYGVWTAILVYAFRHGGTTTAGLIAVVQLVPAAAVAPFAASVVDRRGGAFAAILGYVLQAVAMGATGVLILAGGPPVSVYLPAVVAACAVTISRPAQAKLLSSLVERPEELTAATALSWWIENASALGGPALAGVLIAVGGPGTVFAVFAAAVGAVALLVWPVVRLGSDKPSRPDQADEHPLAGLRVLRTERAVRVLVLAITAEHLAVGALDVIVVVLAITVLHLGSSGAGYLNAIFGAGAAFGGLLGFALAGSRSVAWPLAAAGLGWAIAFSLLGVQPGVVSAFLLLPLAGLGQAVVDTAGRALLARVTPHEVMGRVFGILEGLSAAGLAVGSILVPVLVALGGVRLALIGVAVVLAAATVLPLASLRRLDAVVPPAQAMAAIRGHALFAGLQPAVLEGLARELVATAVRASRVVIAEGDVGDRFYLIAEGKFEVTIAGDYIRTLGPGDGFGEIALLYDLPRTATVIARTDGLLYGLEREPFLVALKPGI